MKVHYYLVLVLLSILIMNMWRGTVVEGMTSLGPAPYSHKPSAPAKKSKTLSYNKEIKPLCEGGFVLPGFPYTMQ